MVNFAQALRDHWVHILVPLGFVVGCYLDRMNDEKLSAFRNKSLLYKRSASPHTGGIPCCFAKCFSALFANPKYEKKPNR
uniref:NADH dehydrogenase [ubiquinone] 1 beta subcomplex subunit 1 n=1 Tax=Calidris pygmaea TaxID=425635 RepID=A0A8C3JL02_9CHAR